MKTHALDIRYIKIHRSTFLWLYFQGKVLFASLEGREGMSKWKK